MKKQLSLSNKLKNPISLKFSRTSRRTDPNKIGFTIVELLVVIVVIGILAAITIVSFTGISQKATVASIQSDLSNAKKQLQLYYTEYGYYPAAPLSNNCPAAPSIVDNRYCLKTSPGNTFTSYTSDGTTFSLEATNTNGMVYNVTDNTGPTAGAIITGSPYIQTITAANCPSTRTQVQDARDGHTYWVQKLADGKCWMLTNLGYAGGGTNTYSDTKTLTNAPGSTYTAAGYYTPTGSNITTEPNAPSTSTDGTGQYGYLYNWCAATGGDLASSGCSSTITTPLPVTTASICPSGWRLPTSNGGEFTALNTAINSGLTSTDAGLIGASWLAQRGGYWDFGFYDQGSYGYYWSSTQYSATVAYYLRFGSTYVNPVNLSSKNGGFAVRCVAV